MKSTATPPIVHACDPVAAAVEKHLLEMQAAGYGDLIFKRKYDAVLIGFGGVWARGENNDIAFVRLAGALLSDDRLGNVFLQRLQVTTPVAFNSRGSLDGGREKSP